MKRTKADPAIGKAPVFKIIQIATAMTEQEVYLFGLGNNGNVYTYDGQTWVKPDMKVKHDSPKI